MKSLLVSLLCFALLAGVGAAMAEAVESPVTPWPQTISPQARQELARRAAMKPRPTGERPVAGQSRKAAAAVQKLVAARQLQRYPVAISDGVIAGVPVRIFTPPAMTDVGHVLINIHGGGFAVDSGSLSENIPIAYLTHTKVIAVLYPLAPENQFPAARDAVIAVYGEILKTHRAAGVILYGTSAGAVLTGEVAFRLKALHQLMPAALGFFSGTADLSRQGASEYDTSAPEGGQALPRAIAQYAGGHDLTDPMLSPLFADLSGLPPTLLIAGTRDVLLSQTTIFHRALRKAGVPAELVVFEAMPHAHWSYLDIPESAEAFETMAEFFTRHLNRGG